MTAAGAERNGSSPDREAPAEQPSTVIRVATGSEPAADPAAGTDPAAVADPVADEPVAVPAGVSGEVTIDLDVEATADPPVAEEPVATDAATGKSGDESAATDVDEADAEGAPVFAQLETLRGDLGELTRDLQRVSAEYANYRKRVDRDRLLVSEQATGAVLTALLPVLDDLDRARSHGDLVGPFAAVSEQLTTALAKFGLTPFGEAGDPFDPSIHEAVAHMSSADVTETTCVEVMRRGYQLGERLLRPALVAVADPQ